MITAPTFSIHYPASGIAGYQFRNDMGKWYVRRIRLYGRYYWIAYPHTFSGWYAGTKHVTWTEAFHTAQMGAECHRLRKQLAGDPR